MNPPTVLFQYPPGSGSAIGDGFLIAYSVASRSTFEHAGRWRDQILRFKDTGDVPTILVGMTAIRG
ncbi:hypothetical protein BC938DRAFT_475275 [Jimgerdemannia flammicorona]|uniref:Uncharacterized protein n=1 Tax=Jimgerdemannia flammicorona TaxID=994334 RepID=A0A433PXC4_9FUNG|nr:hypothetical protein BC938DRAFT_475275 [Jimgerdemannia flammicorona]